MTATSPVLKQIAGFPRLSHAELKALWLNGATNTCIRGGAVVGHTPMEWKRYVLEGRGNVIVWTGPGAYPFAVPPGFTVTTKKEVWERAKKAWLARHPAVARIQ